MSDVDKNRATWDGWPAVPAAAQKEVNKGGYTFTNIDAYWVIEMLTSKFGPMGEGWGMVETKGYYHENLYVYEGRFWYRGTDLPDGKHALTYEIPVHVSYVWKRREKGGPGIRYDEEAPLKAMTRAISKAASYLGLGQEIYQGKTDGGAAPPPRPAAGPPPVQGFTTAAATIQSGVDVPLVCDRCNGETEIRNTKKGVPAVWCANKCGEPKFQGFCYHVSEADRRNPAAQNGGSKPNEFERYGPKQAPAWTPPDSEPPPDSGDDLPF